MKKGISIWSFATGTLEKAFVLAKKAERRSNAGFTRSRR